jgi:hypothetical protein
MKKKYCIHCQTFHTEESICSTCGRSEFQVIIIDVHNQQTTYKILTDYQ